MKTLLAAALVSSACAQDGTSLMQGMARRVDGKLGADGDSKGHDTAKLMETATKMLKNGVGSTPDVEQFIEETITELNTNVLGEITDSHHSDQNAINEAVAEMERVRSVCDTDLASLATQTEEYESASDVHKECRHAESHKCGESRTCEVQLEIDWRQVKTQEARLREIHSEIHSEWCIDPLTPPHGDWDCFGEDCWQWTDVLAMEGPETSQTVRHYPLTDYSSAVGDFRIFSVEKFNEYITQKPYVEAAWRTYNVKIVECAGLETELATRNTQCDIDQDEIATQACTLGDAARTSRRLFGREWDDAIQEYDETAGSCTNAGGASCDIHATDAAGSAADLTCSCTGVRQKEFDRKREWETLKIVTCLLNTVYTHVQRSIDSGEPCPTSESHPEQTEQEITHCHVVEAGLTANLTIDYCGDDLPLECPEPCDLPSPPESVCSAEYVYETQGYFGASLQGTFQPNQAVHLTLSEAGWGACAAPKVCEPCLGHAADLPVDDFTASSASCMQHELHLAHGESDRDTFRCLGGWCLPMAGRCNGVANCGDASDEEGCDTAWQGHAFLQKHEVCRLGANVVPGTADDVQFFCNDGSCTAVEGRCNGVNNCEDGSDEALCPTDVEGVTLEPTSGHTATLETLTASMQVFHDRGYTFKSLGSFSGMKFVKISNEDKNTPHSHVQLKLRIPQPLTVYVVTTQGQTLPWLNQQGWTEVHALSGVEYSGPRMTPDKDWHQANNLYLAGQSIAYGEDLIDIEQEHYGPGHVWEKTFPAGVVSMPGNGGGQGYDWTSGIEGGHGSYLTFLAHPSHPPTPHSPVEPDGRLTAYWDSGSCGPHGDDHNAAWCGGVVNGNHPASHCQEFVTVSSSICASQVATLESYEGDGSCCSSVVINSCNYAYFAQYRCAEDHEVPVVVLPVQFDTRLSAYWDSGNCGPQGDDHNWDWCNRNAGHPASECATSVQVSTDICATGHASLVETQGTGECCESVQIGACNFAYYAQYVCSDAPGPIVIQPVAPIDTRLTAYWDSGSCGPEGDDFNWDWCGTTDGECPDTVTVDSSLCASNMARLETFSGTGECCSSAVIDGCNYAYHAQYVCELD